MKISDAEINAANYQLTRYEEGRGNIQAVKEALEAAYTVRKQRKAAKRERQRKKKDKQVVESVKPATFADFCEGGDKDFTDKHYPSKANVERAKNFLRSSQLNAVFATPSKASESGKPHLAPYYGDGRNAGPDFVPSPKASASKVPEWDGTFRQGHWRLRNDELGTVIEIKFENKYPLIGLCGTSGVNMRWNLNGESFLEKCRDFDLIRPWPKGEQ